MKKPSKTAAELEASIKVEMEDRRPTGARRALTNFRTQCVLAVALFGTHSDPGREGEKRPPTRSARLCGEDRRRRNGRGRATLLAKLAY